MRVWLITIGEPLPVGADVADRLHRTGVLARFLASKGHEVTWWTSTFDHFRKRHVFDHDRDVDTEDGIRLKLLHGRGYASNFSVARFVDHLEIARRLRRLAPREKAPDVILASWPTVELCDEAVRFGRATGVPVILDFRDMWPHIIIDFLPRLARPVGRVVLSPMFRAGARAASGATAIVGVTDAFVDWGLRQGGRARSELDRSFPMAYPQLSHGAETWLVAEQVWDRLGVSASGDDFTVCFLGNISRHLDLLTAVRGARLVAARDPRIRFVLCGLGDMLEKVKGAASGCSNVLLPGWVGAAEIQVLMRRSSVGLDPMPDRYDFLATVNNKAIEYMSAGLPVIATPQRGVLAELLQAEGCGLTYAPGDAEGLATLLLELSGDRARVGRMATSSFRLFRERFTVEKVYSEMAKHLEMIAARRGAGASAA